MNIYLTVQSVNAWAEAFENFNSNLQHASITDIEATIARHYPEGSRDHDAVSLDLFSSYMELQKQLNTQKIVNSYDVPLDLFNQQIFAIDCYIGFGADAAVEKRCRFLLPKRLNPAEKSVSMCFVERLNDYFKLESIPMDVGLNAYWVSDIPNVVGWLAKAAGVRGAYLPLSRFKTNTIITPAEVQEVCRALAQTKLSLPSEVLKELDFRLPTSLSSLLIYLPTAGLI